MTARIAGVVALLAAAAATLTLTVPMAGADPVTCTPTAATATAVVDAWVAPGGTLHLTGAGWCHPADGGSRIGIKIDAGAYSHLDDSVHSNHTIWAIVDADPADGTLDVTVQLPDGTAATSTPVFTEGKHSLTLLSGTLKSGDTVRSVATNEFTVSSQPAPSDGGGGTEGGATAEPACTATSATPTVTVTTPSVPFGATVHVTGAGWCNPVGGGSRIALKLDEGSVERVDTSVHGNKTIWWIVDADATDGTFAADVPLPDGTAATSSPALASGAHTLRFLTGSLKAGDPVRSVVSAQFVVGSYRPNGAPDLLDAKSLTKAAAQGVKAKLRKKSLLLRVPGGKPGDWVFFTAFLADGSPRYPWGDTWYVLHEGGYVSVPRPAPAQAARVAGRTTGDALSGKVKIAAQSGNYGTTGALLGWVTVTFPAPATVTVEKPTTAPVVVTPKPTQAPSPQPVQVAPPIETVPPTPAPTTPSPDPEVAAPELEPVVKRVVETSHFGAADVWLLVAGALVLAGASGFVAWRRRTL